VVEVVHLERITRTETLITEQGKTLDKIEKRLDEIDDKMDSMATAESVKDLRIEILKLENSFTEKFLPKLLSEQAKQDDAIRLLQDRQRIAYWASIISLCLSTILLLVGTMSLKYAHKIGTAVGTAANSFLPQ
jgi:hypothetical protein